MRKLLVLFLAVMVILSYSGLTYAAGSTTNVQQTGNDNEAETDQTGDNQTTTINQDGNKNKADVEQITDNGGEQTADVDQYGGNKNTVFIKQEQIGGGDTSLNSAVAEQNGSRNLIDQSIYAPGYNSGQHVSAY